MIKVYLFLVGLVFICMKCCIYTAIILFLILSSIGLSPEYCHGQVKGEDHYHAWIRVGSYNIEQATFNLYHSKQVDYNNPDTIFTDTKSFMDRVDMWSPVKI
jgi:hypothetical protein